VPGGYGDGHLNGGGQGRNGAGFPGSVAASFQTAGTGIYQNGYQNGGQHNGAGSDVASQNGAGHGGQNGSRPGVTSQNGIPQSALPLNGTPSGGPQHGGPQHGGPQHSAAHHGATPQSGIHQNGIHQNGGHQSGVHQSAVEQSVAAQNGSAQFGYVAGRQAQGGSGPSNGSPYGAGPNGNPPVGPRGPLPAPVPLPAGQLPAGQLPAGQLPAGQLSAGPVPGAGPSQFQQVAAPPDPRSRDPYGPPMSAGFDAVSLPVPGGFGPEQGFGPPQHGPGGALQPAYQPGGPPLPALRVQQPVAIALPEAVKAAHAEGFTFGESVGREAPGLWLEAVLARKPRMPSDLEARLLQGSVLPIDSLLHDEVRHSLRRGFWDALESARR
jgi:hypothetical protein